MSKNINSKAAGLVGLAVACSRVLGLARDMVFGDLFGAGRMMDMFVAAFRAPNLLRDLFAEGALSTAFITVFSRKIATEGEESAWRLASKVATLTIVVMSLITILGVVFAPQFIGILAGGFNAEEAAMTVTLTRIMFPFILFISLAALAMGMLNARNVFGMPAMASSFFNLGSIIFGAGLGYLMDPEFGPRSLIGLAIGTLIGGLLQLLVQMPSLKRVGFRFRPDFRWRDNGIVEILLLMVPAVIAASAVQVNVMVNTSFASQLEEGAISSLNYAFRLMQLPLGMFGVALATVTLPVVARLATEPTLGPFSSTLAKGMRLAFFLTVPSTLGLIFLSEPIIALIWRNFSVDEVVRTAAALKYYAIGLVAYSGIKVLVPAFYAVNRRNLPMIISFISIATNYGLNQLFTFHLGFGVRGLALSTSLVAIGNFTVLYILMRRHTAHLHTGQMVITLLKLLLASAPMALICYGATHWVLANPVGMPLLHKLAFTLGTIGLGAVSFFGIVLMLKIDEVDELMRMVKRKLGRGS